MQRNVDLTLCSLLVLAGCFDVRQVELGNPSPTGTEIVWPTQRSIDDFEDGDRNPSWSAFDAWQVVAWPAPQVTQSGRAEPGRDGAGYGRFLDFELTDPDDGEASYPGAFLGAFPALRALDLSRYDKLVFDARLQSREGTKLASSVPLRAKIGCRGIGKVARSNDEEGLSIGSEVTVDAWETITLDFGGDRGFIQPPWQDWEDVDPRDCLSHAEDVTFELAPNLQDGQTVAGILTLDNVFLQGVETDAFESTGTLLFSPWTCTALSDSDVLPECDLNTGEGKRAPELTFSSGAHTGEAYSAVALCAEPDADPDGDTFDLSEFNSLSFKATLDASAASASGAKFWVEITCQGVSDEPLFTPQLVHEFDPSAGASPVKIDLSQFERGGRNPLRAFNNQACLQVVDALCFTVTFEDGVEQAGALTLDTLMLE